eukprot:6686766-Prymnesium_polylepis.1
MANDAAKKRVIENAALMSKYRIVILAVNVLRACTQAVYVLFRVWYLWASFSGWHMGGFVLTSTIYAVCYFILHKAAMPKYAPLAQGGALTSGGENLGQAGMLEYTWDM